VNALTTAGVGDIEFTEGVPLPAHSIEHHLVAVSIGSNVHITDVEIFNTSGAAEANPVSTAPADGNPGTFVIVKDLIQLVGAGDVGNMLGHNLHFL